ncbi:EamA family transporter [Candidatus Dojkabacteria bacterium]|nr:EamA family transporter [Candidatus Dojkabacteria bacterium]
MKLSDKSKGIIYIFLSITAYSLMPILIRKLDSGNLPPMSQVFLRYCVAFICASVYFVIRKQKLNFKKGNIVLLIITSIIGYGIMNLIYTYSMLYTEVSNALFLFYFSSVITPILGYFFLKEKLNKYNLLSITIAFVALLFLFQPTSVATWKLGGVFGILSALTWAFYLIARKKLKEYSSELILLSSTFFGLITVGSMALIFENDFYFGVEGINDLTSETWLLTVLFGVLNFAGWYFVSKGFEFVKASTGSLIMLVENVVVGIFAFLFLEELPSWGTIIGGFFIMIAAIITILKGDNT